MQPILSVASLDYKRSKKTRDAKSQRMYVPHDLEMLDLEARLDLEYDRN